MKDYDEHIQQTKVKGTLINLYNFHEILPGIKDVAEWQVVITKKDNDPYEVDVLTVNVSPRTGCEVESLIKQIKDCIHSVMELTPRVEVFHNCDNLFNLMGGQIKPKRILDERANLEAASGDVSKAVTTSNGPKLAN
jgi:phenylacetate-coenzyme A ligase PaaK-like adenylate-forming protein